MVDDLRPLHNPNISMDITFAVVEETRTIVVEDNVVIVASSIENVLQVVSFEMPYEESEVDTSLGKVKDVFI